MTTVRVVGMDPSLRHWGLARGTYDLVSKELQIVDLAVLEPVLPTGKQTRQNSLDLESAHQLYLGAVAFAEGAHVVFVEVPHGSQSARAAVSYALCVGVLGAMRANRIPFFEQTEAEGKLATVGKKTATKKEMIEWASTRHPQAPWPTYKEHGVTLISETKAEHMADASAAIHAGLSSNAYQQLLRFMPVGNQERKHADQFQAT